MVSTKDNFLFILVFLEEWDGHGSMDLKRQREEKLQRISCRLFALHHSMYAFNLSLELGCGKRIDASKFQQLSVNIVLFWIYIQNLDNGYPSLSEYHTHKVFWPISDHPDPASKFCITLHKFLFFIYYHDFFEKYLLQDFEFRVLFFLDWLPTKAREHSLNFYLTHSWWR